MGVRTKQFIVEITIPDETGVLCWDQDETGLQAFHDCIVSVLPIISLRNLVAAVNENIEYQQAFNDKEMQNEKRIVSHARKDSSIDTVIG